MDRRQRQANEVIRAVEEAARSLGYEVNTKEYHQAAGILVIIRKIEEGRVVEKRASFSLGDRFEQNQHLKRKLTVLFGEQKSWPECLQQWFDEWRGVNRPKAPISVEDVPQKDEPKKPGRTPTLREGSLEQQWRRTVKANTAKLIHERPGGFRDWARTHMPLQVVPISQADRLRWRFAPLSGKDKSAAAVQQPGYILPKLVAEPLSVKAKGRGAAARREMERRAKQAAAVAAGRMAAMEKHKTSQAPLTLATETSVSPVAVEKPATPPRKEGLMPNGWTALARLFGFQR